MIIGSLKNTERVEGLAPRFKKIFDYLKSHDLTEVLPGKIDLDGEYAWISVSEVQGKPQASAKLETHDKYIDIQLPLKGRETFGWQAREDLKQEQDGGYNEEKDITFYADESRLYFTLQPGDFGIFFPEDGHAPCIGEGTIKKVVVKVKV